MALPLRDAFTARAIGLNWNRYEATLGETPYLGRQKFGTRKQEGHAIRFIKGKSGLPVALKASNFDAQAELRDGIGVSDIQNEMPFFRESYMVTEKEEQDYASYMAAQNDGYANQVLTEIMKKPLDLVKGARVVPERMIWQLLAPVDGIPKVTVNIKGQLYNIDYTTDNGAEYKKNNFIEIKGDNAWDKPETAKPLEDLIQIQRDFRKKTGMSLVRFSMNTETFEMICNAEDTKKQVMGIIAYNGGIRMRQSDVTAYLAEYGISIEVYDKMYLDEISKESKYFIPTGMISAQASGIYLGEFVFGTTPEMRSGNEADGSLAVVDTGISLYTYSTEHPINTHCICSMIGLPSYEGMDGVAVIKVTE